MILDVFTIGVLRPSNPPPGERILCFMTAGQAFPSWDEAIDGVKAHYAANGGPAGALEFTAYKSDDGLSGFVELSIGRNGMTAMGLYKILAGKMNVPSAS